MVGSGGPILYHGTKREGQGNEALLCPVEPPHATIGQNRSTDSRLRITSKAARRMDKQRAGNVLVGINTARLSGLWTSAATLSPSKSIRVRFASTEWRSPRFAGAQPCSSTHALSQFSEPIAGHRTTALGGVGLRTCALVGVRQHERPDPSSGPGSVALSGRGGDDRTDHDSLPLLREPLRVVDP